MKATCSILGVASIAAVTSGLTTTLQQRLEPEQIIAMINTNKHATWESGVHEFGMTIDEMRNTLGTAVSDSAPLVANNDVLTEDDINSLPVSYDVREKWGHCVHPIRNQAKCGSCWAFGASEVLSDRYCMAGVNVVLSPEYLLACDNMDMGCNGGRLDTVWLFMKEFGLPTDKCEPYSSGETAEVPQCPDRCKNGEQPKKYKAKSAYSVVTWLDSPEDRVHKIKKEILSHGPVEAAFWVYEDFMTYRSGVYKHMAGGMMGGHAIKLVGWGVDKNDEGEEQPYWLVANSWGPTWGENGFFKIASGSNECNIEMNIWAGLPNVEDTYYGL